MIIDYLEKINSNKDIVYIVIRTFIIYIYAIFLIRIGSKRFHLKTVIDFILFIIIGSVLSRTIDGSATLLDAMAGSFILVLLHKIFAILTFYSHNFGKIIKGKPIDLIYDGKVLQKNMEKNQITHEDLIEMCRENLNINDLSQIKEAKLERTGNISFIKK